MVVDADWKPPRTKNGLRRLLARYRATITGLRTERDRWEQRYEDEHHRIVNLALEHLPQIDATSEDSLPGFDKTISLFGDRQPRFTCKAKHCCYFWPCPTYKWATGTADFALVIERKAPTT